MFAIHDRQGLKLRGSMEQLRQHKQPAPDRLKRHQLFWDQPDTTGPVLAFTQPATAANRYEKAEALYRRMLNLRVNEPVVHAHQVMSSYVYTLSPQDSLADAWRWMRDYQVEQMPVVGEGEGVVSLLARRDIESLLLDQKLTIELLARKSVETVMPEEIITTEPVASIRRIARVMVDYQQHAMPVVDDRDKLVGIVTRGDILRVLSEQSKLSFWT
ncbi:CBS domain-containing protein [Motiliproteus sediminis]|uniref:CBS domain-containing protein n=1 Tax=Motiliproteus sediminis TaxID=1468178 RepID=UPI001AEF822E|nr:CBS domain-containing protein [Motiliproteus sediminis]